jgi:GNAT superfamily N-acetyltransferase
MKFTQTKDAALLTTYRSQLYQQLTAPIDAMWEELYIGSSPHYLIEDQGQTIGYCCIDDQKDLKQLFLVAGSNHQMTAVVRSLVDEGLMVSASLSSNEPIAFNACLFPAKSIKANTFCFQHTNDPFDLDFSLPLALVTPEEIPLIKAFLLEQVGMDDTFGYTENLVQRQAIYRIREGDTIIATSECRFSTSQPKYADLGMIVHHDHRGRGLGTQLMKRQVNYVLASGRLPICSTTHDNLASKKAIARAGFYCSNIIFEMQLVRRALV